MSIKTSKTEKQREKRLKKCNRLPRTVGKLQKCNVPIMGSTEGEGDSNRRNIWSNNDWISQN